MKRRVVLAALMIAGVILLAGFGSLLLWSPAAFADEAVGSAAVGIAPGVLQWGYLAAAIATGLSALGAAIAVASVGTAAVGALAEKPELFGRVVILVGLAEGIAIYGVIVSVLILNKLG